MSKIKITRQDIGWTYLNYFVNFGLNIAVLPIIYRMLNPVEIGFWYVLLAIGGLAEIMDLGFSTIISRNVSYVASGGSKIKAGNFENQDLLEHIDYKLLSNLISASGKIYKYLSWLVFGVLSSAGTVYIYFVSIKELPKATILLSWTIFIIAIVFRVRFSYWNYVLRGVGAIKENNKAVIISKLLQFSILLILIAFGFGVVGASLGYLVGMLSQRLLCLVFFFNYEDFGARIKEFNEEDNKNIIKDIISALKNDVFKQGQITLSYYLINKSMVLLSSAFFNLSIAGMIGFSQQLLSLVSSFSNSLFNAYLPQFTSERLSSNVSSLYKKLTMSLGLSFTLIVGSGFFLALFGNKLFGILDMNSQVLPYKEMIVFVLTYVLINNHFLCGTYITASNNLIIYKSYSISAGIMIVFQVMLSIYFPEIGVWSLLLPAIIIQSVYNNWKWPSVVANEFNTTLLMMMKDSVTSAFKVLFKIFG